jgi:hypothetical protein
MPHVFGAAPTGRSKCRGCGEPIAKGEVRFGESLPNPYAEGEITHWFHPLCAAYKRPEVLLEALAAGADVADGDKLGQSARRAMEHPRVPRIDGAERAPSGQARCRHCHELIERGAWRIRLVFHEEGNFAGGGFVHLHCRGAYFETDDILEQVLHFSRGLGADERAALAREFDRSPP